MNNLLDYDDLKATLHVLNTDDTISSAHGILCGFACVKPELTLDDWLNEVLVSIDLNNLNEKSAHEALAQIFNGTLSQLNDATLDFQLLMADEDARLGEQANTLIEWCQGYLVGLGLQKISTTDEDALEMIKDISEISNLDADVVDSEQNAQDLFEIIEFVRMGVLLIQETLQPSKQDYISPETLH
ncbi:MAG: YecA family protein [Candidatus Thioglobus sp.]|uniref:YecA family protein n=1 Tax=Candidatus Thioglobus sp. TaxID=2026721 RepID=UPI00262CAB7A|nr:YecA family protein [Candidatus Thioglobus sp.]MDC9726974.1 YecA family protein [Candidatus Thioglobus sp.]